MRIREYEERKYGDNKVWWLTDMKKYKMIRIKFENFERIVWEVWADMKNIIYSDNKVRE